MNITSMDEIMMRLIHYFVTKENYQPIVVAGLENEIWLENIDKKYAVIRINSNYIHNNEQLKYDVYKAKTVVRQIKRKTFSFKCNTLSILLNTGDNVSDFDSEDRGIDVFAINSIDDLNSEGGISTLFPEIKNDVIEADDAMDFFINVTNDINDKTEEKNRLYEKTFKKKPIVLTYVIIIINIVLYLLTMLKVIDVNDFLMNAELVKAGDYYRLITAAFFHGGALHLACNMYALYVLGTELETVLGRAKFLIVYLGSALIASLLSGVINGGAISSVGASGALFGLMGAMLYFGYHYRLYLGSVLASQLIPLIAINLFIGFALPYIDNYGHIGGLIGGLFFAMIVGVEGKSDRSDTINGLVVTAALIVFLFYMLFR